MARRDARHPVRRLLLALVVVLALVAGAGVASWRTSTLDGWRDGPLGEWVEALVPPDPVTDPERVDPPAGLELPDPAAPEPVAEPVAAADSGLLDPAAVRAALRPALADRDLGPHVVATVAPVSGGPAVARGAGPAVPASTTKLLTATAALAALGPERTFATTTVLADGTVTLVGGGDPLLSRGPAEGEPAHPGRADTAALARATAAALRRAGTTRVRLAVDDTLFSGPTASPRWRRDYVPDGVVSPITALWVDRGVEADGLGRVDDPTLEAGRALAAQLRGAGVRVVGDVVRRPAPPGATALARVDSPTVAELVAHLLLTSDNETSEVLAHHVGREVVGSGSFTGAAEGVRRTLADLGVPLEGVRLFDGSGLSRANRVSGTTLLSVLLLAAAPEHPELRSVLVGLPVAGFSGSLADRFGTGEPAGLGAVRAKTGTLTGVHALAGLATTVDGVVVAFALLADRVPEGEDLEARTALDRAAAALAACRCAAAP